jgi:hypothetical protein
VTYAYQWKRNGANISGATANTYTLVTADFGTKISATVTATNTAGSTSATSGETATVTKTTLNYTPVTSATNGTPYTGATPSTTGGTSPYVYSNTGTLPAGTTLNTSTGVISGTPTTTATYSGIVLTVTDANGIAASSASFTITVSAGAASLATPTLTSLTTATDTGTSSTDGITSDTTPDIEVTWGTPPLEGDIIEVRSNGVLISSHTVTGFEEGTGTIALSTPLASGSNSLTVTHKRGASASSPSNALVVVIDATAPVLTSPGGMQLAATTATLSVTTNEANGVLYYVVTTSATFPTAAQVKAGQNNTGAAAMYAGSQVVSAAGEKTATATGLTAGSRYAYYMQEDVAGNISSVTQATWSQAGTNITWDPARKNAAITLSADKLTGSIAANTFYANMLGTGSGRSTGKYYCEMKLNTMNPDGQGFGFGNASAGLGALIAIDLNSVGWRGAVYMESTNIGTIQIFAQGDTLGMAVDLDAKRVWFRCDRLPNWNNNAANNPETNVGGLSFTGMNAGPYWPMASLEINGDNFTANFGDTAYAMTKPPSFGNW